MAWHSVHKYTFYDLPPLPLVPGGEGIFPVLPRLLILSYVKHGEKAYILDIPSSLTTMMIM